MIECVFNTDTGVAYSSNNELIDLQIPAGQSFIGKFFRFLDRVKAVKSIKKSRKVDLCISMLEGADYVNILSQSSEKVWLCIQGSKIYDNDIRYKFISKRILMPWLYNRPDTIVAVSNGIKDELEKELKIKSRIIVIENPFDKKLLGEKLAEDLPPEFLPIYDNRVITTSGRLHEQKNQLILFSIMNELITKGEDTKLIVLGDGPWRDKMELEAAKFPFKTWFAWNREKATGEERIYFIGFTVNPFVFIQKSDLFVLPSAWEGFPLALIEAMATKTTVLAADCPTGPKEIMSLEDKMTYGKQDYGYLLEIPTLEKYDKWVTVISSILQDESTLQEMRLKAGERANHFRSSIILQKWKVEIEELWKEVLSE